MANTGYKAWTTLKKVTDDANEYPLDVNGDLCSVSGLPQATKPNTEGQPDYVAPVADYVTCPVTTPVNLKVELSLYNSRKEIKALLTDKGTGLEINAPINITVNFNFATDDDPNIDYNVLVITSGNSTAYRKMPLGSTDKFSFVEKTSVYPTSYGGGTIE